PISNRATIRSLDITPLLLADQALVEYGPVPYITDGYDSILSEQDEVCAGLFPAIAAGGEELEVLASRLGEGKLAGRFGPSGLAELARKSRLAEQAQDCRGERGGIGDGNEQPVPFMLD